MQNLFMCFLFSDFYKRTYKRINTKNTKIVSENNNESKIKPKGPYEEYAEKLF